MCKVVNENALISLRRSSTPAIFASKRSEKLSFRASAVAKLFCAFARNVGDLVSSLALASVWAILPSKPATSSASLPRRNASLSVKNCSLVGTTVKLCSA
eukprot:scaffold116_cov233-Pinguiococcus_pyrenoidosus.AAC.8